METIFQYPRVMPGRRVLPDLNHVDANLPDVRTRVIQTSLLRPLTQPIVHLPIIPNAGLGLTGNPQQQQALEGVGGVKPGMFRQVRIMLAGFGVAQQG